VLARRSAPTVESLPPRSRRSCVAVALLDFSVLFVCAYFYAVHLILAFLPNDLSRWLRVSVPLLGFCLAALLARAAAVRLAGGSGTRAGEAIDGVFFGFVSFCGLLSGYVLTRADLQLSYPRIWDVISLLLGLWLASRLPKRLRRRRLPTLVAVCLSFHYFFLVTSKAYVSEADFLPVTEPGVRTFLRIEDPLTPGRAHPLKAIRPVVDLLGWLLKDFSGVPLATRQNAYLALSADEDFLYVNDLDIRGGLFHVRKVRLNDLTEVAAFTGDRSFFQHMVEDPVRNRLVAASYLTRELCSFQASQLEPIACVPAGIADVLGI
jgi:hypothetical protein